MVSHLCPAAGGFFLKVGPVTGPRLAVPAAKRRCQESRGAAVCCFPPKALFFQEHGSEQVGAWAEGLETKSVYPSLCSCRIQNVGAGLHSCYGSLGAMTSGHGPSLNSRLSSVFFHHLARLSCDILTFQLDFAISLLSLNAFHLCSTFALSQSFQVHKNGVKSFWQEQEWLKCQLWLDWIPSEHDGVLVGDHS